jgi:hypothetical protein
MDLFHAEYDIKNPVCNYCSNVANSYVTEHYTAVERNEN